MIKKLHDIVKKLITKSLLRYLTVGVTAFFVEYAMFFMLFRFAWLGVLGSSALSFVFGLLTSFMLNKFWTFGGHAQHHQASKQLQMYLTLAFVNLLVALSLVKTMIYIGVSPELAKLISMAMVALWNYFIFQKLIFKRSN